MCLVFLCLNFVQDEVKGEQRRDAEVKIKRAIGFRHVIDLLSAEKKLIVGHNCFLGMNISPQLCYGIIINKVIYQLYHLVLSRCDTDLAHIYGKFMGPLPSTAEEFVSLVNHHFPHIIDTKLLLNSNNILQQRMRKLSTSLSSAFSILCSQIALGSKSPYLSLYPCAKVEVQVDDMRFVSALHCSAGNYKIRISWFDHSGVSQVKCMFDLWIPYVRHKTLGEAVILVKT